MVIGFFGVRVGLIWFNDGERDQHRSTPRTHFMKIHMKPFSNEHDFTGNGWDKCSKGKNPVKSDKVWKKYLILGFLLNLRRLNEHGAFEDLSLKDRLI